MFVQTNAAAIGRVDGINVSPMRTVQNTRPHQLDTAVQWQIGFAQMIERRIERKPVQILDNTDAFGMGLRPPIPLEGLLEPLFQIPLTENFGIVLCNETKKVVFVHFLVVIQSFFEFQVNGAQLNGPIFTEQIVQKGSHQFYTLVLEIVAVRGRFNSGIGGNKTEHNVTQCKRFGNVIGLPNVGQEVVCKDFQGMRNPLSLCQKSNVFERVLLCHDRGCIMYGRNENVDERFVFLHVQEAIGYNLLVASNTQCAEHDEKRNGSANVGDFHDDLFVGKFGRGSGHLYRESAHGFGCIFRNAPHFRRV